MDYSKQDNNKKIKSEDLKHKKRKNKALTITFRVLIATTLISIFALGGIVVGAYIGIIENVSRMSNMSVVPNMFTSIVYDMHGNEAFRYTSAENREYVSLDYIPKNLQNAFIAIEDERFFSHNGIDIRGIIRAAHVTLFTDRREGGSTITQQLVKNNILRLQRNTLETKIQEQFLALRLERQLTEQLGSRQAAKEYILEVYLNTIYLANGLHGVQTASRFYFNKDVSELTLSESAVIASITQNPSFYNPVRFPENNRNRQVVVLDKMLELGFINHLEHFEAINDDVFSRVNEFRDIARQESNIHSSFSDHLFETLVEDLIREGHVSTRAEASNMIFNGGLSIYTTLDPNIQNILEEAYLDDSLFPTGEFRIDVTYTLSLMNSITDEVSNHERTGTFTNRAAIDPWVESVREELIGTHDVILGERVIPVSQPQSAMVIIDHSTGEVRGLVGVRGEKTENRSLNRATQSTRHPGSAFKMLAAYAPAMDLGIISPSSILNDSPFNHNGYQPRNYDNRFRGPVSVRESVARSLNVVAVKTMNDVGVNTAFDYLLQFGFTTLADGDVIDGQIFTDRGLPTALGGLSHGVTQLEMAAAYGAIANLGVYIEPTVYRKVLDHEGNILLESNPETRQVLQRETAYLLTDTMKDVVNSGIGTGRMARLNSNMPVAGKTGTSQNSVDLTFVGYTPYYVASIWLGHDDHRRPISTTTNSHLTLWAHVMNRIHENLPVKPFYRPSGIVSATICMDSGLLAIPGLCDHDYRGARTRTDIFNISNLPTLHCSVHGSIIIDILTGLPATEETPYYRRREFIGAMGPGGTIISDNLDLGEVLDNYTAENEGSITPIIDNEDYVFDPGSGAILPIIPPNDTSSNDTNNIINNIDDNIANIDSNDSTTIPPNVNDTIEQTIFEPIPDFNETSIIETPIIDTSPPETQAPPPLNVTSPNIPPIIE